MYRDAALFVAVFNGTQTLDCTVHLLASVGPFQALSKCMFVLIKGTRMSSEIHLCVFFPCWTIQELFRSAVGL